MLRPQKLLVFQTILEWMRMFKKDMIHGQSSKPKAMLEAPHLHKPVVRINEATKAVEMVVNWILKKET